MLANLFMHYAFDTWLEREFPAVEFERYADDAVVHCATERQARKVLAALAERMEKSGCGCTRTKPRSCTARTGTGGARLRAHVVHVPGYMFRPRRARPGRDELFTSFLPAVSPDALKRMSAVRSWRIHMRTATDLGELAEWINPS